MSYHVFFEFSVGLKKPILVPQGTLKVCQDHVARVERTLGFETVQSKGTKRVLKFKKRAAAEAKAKLYPKRALVVVPVRRP